MNFKLIDNHLLRSTTVTTSYDKFDALWAAFNVMYESKRVDCIRQSVIRNPMERSVVKFCARLLPYHDWIDLFPSRGISNLFTIAPILNVRDLLRNSQMNTQEFD